ncbi:DUF58 domain-containing protein [Priestia filamentosa]|uniref:DUF58 domain-containing protein n=1 Tax=Priestia filamentosa TaxID=1402861 RepID=UPI001FB47799|nr:DUF58 domain-containing protein [Priestia filamentosa]UOE60323.1 DUF58 domain-containing protein [Priestia filamentosa]
MKILKTIREHYITQLFTVVFMVGFLFSYAMFQGGFVSWFLLYSFSPILLYSFLLLLYPVKRVKVKRSLEKSSYFYGETVKFSIEIELKRFFPIAFLIVEEKCPKELEGETNKLRKIYSPFFKRHITFHYEIPSARRGEHKLTELTIKASDLFGLVFKKGRIKTEDSFIVLPNVLDVQPFIQSYKEQEGEKLSLHKGNQSNIVSGVRNYIAGDKFSQIHWKASARVQGLVSKEFEPRIEEDEGIGLLVDLRNDNYFEQRMSLAASFMYWMATNDQKFQILLIGRKGYSGKVESLAEMKQVLYYLATVKSEEDYPFWERAPHELQRWSRMRELLVFPSEQGIREAAMLEKAPAAKLHMIIPNEGVQHSALKSSSFVLHEVNMDAFENGIIEVNRQWGNSA